MRFTKSSIEKKVTSWTSYTKWTIEDSRSSNEISQLWSDTAAVLWRIETWMKVYRTSSHWCNNSWSTHVSKSCCFWIWNAHTPIDAISKKAFCTFAMIIDTPMPSSAHSSARSLQNRSWGRKSVFSLSVSYSFMSSKRVGKAPGPTVGSLFMKDMMCPPCLV